jgi:MFS family permease
LKFKKLANIAIIASIASKSHIWALLVICTDKWIVLSPLASSMFAPGIRQIAESLNISENEVTGCQTGFVVMLGIGPLILAPLSETFGRKPLYLICFTAFCSKFPRR